MLVILGALCVFIHLPFIYSFVMIPVVPISGVSERARTKITWVASIRSEMPSYVL